MSSSWVTAVDILDGWHGTLVLFYLGAVALTLKLRPHWLLTPGADPLSLWLRARRSRRAYEAALRTETKEDNREAAYDGSEQ